MVSHHVCQYFVIEKVEVDGPDLGYDRPALWALWLFMVCHIMKNLQCTLMAAVCMAAGLDCAKLSDVVEADM